MSLLWLCDDSESLLPSDSSKCFLGYILCLSSSCRTPGMSEKRGTLVWPGPLIVTWHHRPGSWPPCWWWPHVGQRDKWDGPKIITSLWICVGVPDLTSTGGPPCVSEHNTSAPSPPPPTNTFQSPCLGTGLSGLMSKADQSDRAAGFLIQFGSIRQTL